MVSKSKPKVNLGKPKDRLKIGSKGKTCEGDDQEEYPFDDDDKPMLIKTTEEEINSRVFKIAQQVFGVYVHP